jgi:Gram-negative bacterial TonB protein C-terminal/PilZ domain
MPDSLPQMPPKGPLTTERRQNPRHPVRPTEYIEIGDSNGGIILDISEGGMAVASAQALVGNQTLRFRFQLPRSLETIETSGEINWIGETKKRAGVRFVDLPLAACRQIQEWIDSETSGHSNGNQKPTISAVSSASAKIPQELPRYGPVHRELAHQQATIVHGHNPSKNLNPFSSELSGPLDEPEIDEPEPEDEEKNTVDSNAQSPSEKRAERRLPMTASTYVQLSDGNGGLMANLSKTGFSVRAAKTLETDRLPVVRFQLPNARDFIESSAWIVWKSPSKKTVGARFESLSDEAQSQIAQWIDSQPLPKNAAIKTPLSKDRLSPNPLASSRSGQREKISPSPKTPASATAVPVTSMAPDSVPIPAYISPLAISLDVQPAVPPVNNPSSTPSLTKAPPIASPSKPSPPATEKTPVQVPAIIPSPAKPVTVASAAVSPRSQKSLSTPATASSSNAPNLAFPIAPRVVLGPATPVAPPIFNEPDWSVAPKRPTGYWKIAAMIVVIVGTLFGTATLLRSKKSATPASQETTQNSSIAASVPTVTPSTDPVANSAVTNSAPTNRPTPSSTASASNSGSSREFSDTPRNTTPAKSSPKGDEQFVDEPLPSHSQPQISSPPVQSDNPGSRAYGAQPSSSGPVPSQSGGERNHDQPAEQNSGSVVAVRREQATPAPVFSNANGEAASAPDSLSPPPAPAASRDQQASANLGSAADVTQNSSSAAHPAATSENNSSPRTAAPSVNPALATTTETVPASSPAATNSVPTVSVFSRFRAIRSASDAARPAGSDLQIGRLKSGPAPPYPIEAQRQQIQGTVELQVLVGADGSILTVHLVKGPPELASVAMGTVRSWQYGQTTLGGHPVETDQSIYFTFKLTK